MSIIHNLLRCGKIQKFTALNVCFGFFPEKLAADLLFMCLIGFIDLKNIVKNTKIMVIGVQGA